MRGLSGGGQSYGAIDKLSDSQLRIVLRQMQDRINSLQGRLGDTPTFRQSISLDGNKAMNAADPEEDGDLVTLRYLNENHNITFVRNQLQASGPAPLDLTGLSGSSSIAIGTHAERVIAPAVGVFFESDRNAIYYAAAGVWILFSALYRDSFANRPADLDTNDGGKPGFLFKDKDDGLIWRWSGNVWHYYAGIIRDVIANRPTAVSGVVDGGVIFEATDQGGQAWFFDNAGVGWVLLPGWGNPFDCTLTTLPTLAAEDAGFRINATDFNREYTWGGAAWGDSPGQDSRGLYVDLQGGVPDPAAGWIPADGALHTNGLSTPTAGRTNITPNLVANYYVRV